MGASGEKVLIAMSGGVDSSVAAYLMKQSGRDCMGVTMKLYHNEDVGMEAGRTCCSLDDIEDARSVAFRLGIPYHVFNFTEDFREKVIDHFIASYERGETPNPCIDCNRYLKFHKLYQRARMLGCDHIATGHYVRLEQKDGRILMKKAVDRSKDQSYVLYMMTQEELHHTYFPLGEKTKDEIRALAESAGLVTAGKPDSQDICFVPDGDYAAAIERLGGKVYQKGEFVDKQENVLGQHQGIVRYTTGQRKGLGIALGHPVYVIDKKIMENQVVLGTNEDLFSRSFDVKDVNWILYDVPPETFRAKVRVRYHQKEQWADLHVTGPDQVHVVFDTPQRAITSGQAAVFYDNEYVVGGGTIC